MRTLIRKLEPVLQLTRVTAAFGAVVNVWFVVLWTRQNPNEPGYRDAHDVASGELFARDPLWLLLLGGACCALGLSAFGAALNDFLDANRDRALGLDRPLAAGRASPELALSAVAGTLIFAALGATAFGMPAVIVTLLLAAGVIGYNTAARFVPGVGFVALGVIHAVLMMVPNLSLAFLAPVWLVMTHTIVVAGLTHWLARKSPTISRRAIVGGVLGWAVCSLVLLAVAFRHGGSVGVWPAWVPLTAPVFPGVLVVAFAFLAIRRISSLGSGVRSAEKIRRYGALWMPLYACAWLFGSGHFDYAALMGAVALVGFLGMTALREAYTMLEHPVGYRR